MQKRRKQFGAVAAVIVSMALLAAPWCSVACAAADIFAALATQTVEPGSQSHHCHQSPAQPLNPGFPQPEHHSHNCENHQAALLLSNKGSLSVPNSVALFQPYLPAPFAMLLTGQTQVRHRNWRDSLKAPPRAQLRTILRI